MADISNRGRWFRSLLLEQLKTMPLTVDKSVVKILDSQIHAADNKDYPYAYVELTNMMPKFNTISNLVINQGEQKFFIACGAKSGVGAFAALDDLHSDLEACVDAVFVDNPLGGLVERFSVGEQKITVAIHRVRVPSDELGVARVLNDESGIGEIVISGSIIFSQAPLNATH